MRVGIVARTATYAPLYALPGVELVELGSTAAGVDALLSGRVDVAATCPDALIASAAPLRIGAGLISRPPTSIVAADRYGRIRDLRGERIGTTSERGSVSIFLRAVLRAHGLERGDYREVVIGPTPPQAAALERGDIAAAMLTAPFDAQLAARGFRILADVGAELGPCAFTTLNVRAGSAAGERWAAFLRALEEAIRGRPLAYDLSISAATVGRLIALMRADGIAVTRGAGDVLEERATASPSP